MPNEMMSMDPNSAVREGEMMRSGSSISPMEDMKLVESLMMMIDPGATARSDFSNAQGLFGSLVGLKGQLEKGQKLSPNIRKSLADQAMVMMNDMDPQRMSAMMDPGSAAREGEMGYTVDGQTQNMTPAQYQEMVNSGQITQDPNLMGPR